MQLPLACLKWMYFIIHPFICIILELCENICILYLMMEKKNELNRDIEHTRAMCKSKRMSQIRGRSFVLIGILSSGRHQLRGRSVPPSWRFFPHLLPPNQKKKCKKSAILGKFSLYPLPWKCILPHHCPPPAMFQVPLYCYLATMVGRSALATNM